MIGASRRPPAGLAPAALALLAVTLGGSQELAAQRAGFTSLSDWLEDPAQAYNAHLVESLTSRYDDFTAANGGRPHPAGMSVGQSQILARDQYISQLEQQADHLHWLRGGSEDREGIGREDKRDRIRTLIERSQAAVELKLPYEREIRVREERLRRDEYAAGYPPSPEMAHRIATTREQIEALRAERQLALARALEGLPELAVYHDGRFLFEALAPLDPGTLATVSGTRQVSDVVDAYLESGERGLRDEIARIRRALDWSDLEEFGNPTRYGNIHRSLEIEGEEVGSHLMKSYVETLRGQYGAYAADQRVSDAWWTLGMLVATAVFIPVAVVSATWSTVLCAGVGLTDAVFEANELRLTFAEVDQARAAATVTGIGRVETAESERLAQGVSTGLAVAFAGVDVLDVARVTVRTPSRVGDGCPPPTPEGRAASEAAAAPPQGAAPSAPGAPTPSGTPEPTGAAPPPSPPAPTPAPVGGETIVTGGTVINSPGPPIRTPEGRGIPDPELARWYEQRAARIRDLEQKIAENQARGFHTGQLENDLDMWREMRPPQRDPTRRMAGDHPDYDWVEANHLEDLDRARTAAREAGVPEDEIRAIIERNEREWTNWDVQRQLEDPHPVFSELEEATLLRTGEVLWGPAPEEIRTLSGMSGRARENGGRLLDEDFRWLEERGGVDFIQAQTERFWGRRVTGELEPVLPGYAAEELAEMFVRSASPTGRGGTGAGAAVPQGAPPRVADSPGPPTRGGAAGRAATTRREEEQPGRAPAADVRRDASTPVTGATEGAAAPGELTAYVLGTDVAPVDQVPPPDPVVLEPGEGPEVGPRTAIRTGEDPVTTPSAGEEPGTTPPAGDAGPETLDREEDPASETPPESEREDASNAMSVGPTNAAEVLQNPIAVSAARAERQQIMIMLLPGVTLEPRVGVGALDGIRFASASHTTPWEAGSIDRAMRDAPGGLPGEELLLLFAPDRGVTAYVTSLGGSTGPVFRLHALNGGSVPVRLDGAAVVVEPVVLTAAAQAELEGQLEALAARQGVSVPAVGYCLEFLREPPGPGTLLRVAGREVQERYAPAREIATAASRLRELGRLHPDTDPESYLHSILQWALWSHEQRFTPGDFAQAFLEHMKENATAAGHRWSAELEEAIRGVVPTRWEDIQLILRTALDG